MGCLVTSAKRASRTGVHEAMSSEWVSVVCCRLHTHVPKCSPRHRPLPRIQGKLEAVLRRSEAS